MLDRSKVYINCPYDKEFEITLEIILFTVIFCNKVPFVCENPTSGDHRILAIKEIIEKCHFSIHDLSRLYKIKSTAEIEEQFENLNVKHNAYDTNSDGSIVFKNLTDCANFYKSMVEETEIPKFNMPLELGMDLGYHHFNGHSKKSLLITLESKQKFTDFISDLGGYDIKEHKGVPRTIIKDILAWLEANDEKIPSGNVIHTQFGEYQRTREKIHLQKNRDEYDIENLTRKALISDISAWIQAMA